MTTLNRVQFEVSTDRWVLGAYYELRYREYLRTFRSLRGRFKQEPDDFDHTGLILIGRDEDEVVAGARINISTPKNRGLLPLEDDRFRLIDSLGELGLEDSRYGEVSRVAVRQDYQNGAVSRAMAGALIEVANRYELDYLFSVCPPPQARLNRLNSHAYGLDFRVFRNVPLPEAPSRYGIPMWLCAYAGFAAVRETVEVRI